MRILTEELIVTKELDTFANGLIYVPVSSKILTTSGSKLQTKNTNTTTNNMVAKLCSFCSWVVNWALRAMARLISFQVIRLNIAKVLKGMKYINTKYIQVM